MAAAYDDLPDEQQARLRAVWDAQLAADLAAADYTEALNAAGKPWAEADADGNVIWHTPDPE